MKVELPRYMKQLVICPECEKKGKREILGERTPDGYFHVLRFHQGTTTITGTHFQVVCRCGNVCMIYQGTIPV